MKASITSNTRTEGQEKQLRRMFEDMAKSAVELALNKMNPERKGTQRLLGQGDEIKSAMNDFIIAQVRKYSFSNQFAKEEVKSNYGYLFGYKPNGEDLDRQIAVLQGLFPELGGPNTDYLEKVKSGAIKMFQYAEKFFAIPNIWKPEGLPIFGQTYSQALQIVLDKIMRTRDYNFDYYLHIYEKYIRLSDRTTKFFQKLSEEQGHPDILIVSAQFGLLHRGRSIRRVREVFLTNESGLGAYEIGIMLLTHPERLELNGHLWFADTVDQIPLQIDCPGDEYSSKGDGVFDFATFFEGSYGNKVFFEERCIRQAHNFHGSASAFLPQ